MMRSQAIMTFWETISNRAYWNVIVKVFANLYALDMLQSIQNPNLFKQNHNYFIYCIVMGLASSTEPKKQDQRVKLKLSGEIGLKHTPSLQNFSQVVRTKTSDKYLPLCVPLSMPLPSSMLNKNPHCFIGVIRLRDYNGRTSFVTGTLIRSNIVLTSAHPLFIIGKKQITEMRPFEFVLNLHGDLQNPRTIRVPIADYRYPKEYETPLKKMFKYKPGSEEGYNSFLEGVQHDYALLRLEKQVQIPTSSYPILVPDCEEKNKQVTVCGYSQQKQYEYYQMTCSNKLQTSGKYEGRYDIDIQLGQSGSPVYFMEKVNAQEVVYVVGIHKGFDGKQNLKICTLLTEEIINKLRQWENQWLVSTKGAFRVRQAEEKTKTPDNIKQMMNNFQFPTNVSGGKSKEPKSIYIKKRFHNNIVDELIQINQLLELLILTSDSNDKNPEKYYPYKYTRIKRNQRNLPPLGNIFYRFREKIPIVNMPYQKAYLSKRWQFVRKIKKAEERGRVNETNNQIHHQLGSIMIVHSINNQRKLLINFL